MQQLRRVVVWGKMPWTPLMFTWRTFLAGRDGPEQAALPAGEFLHPVPVAALLILIANDWWLKGSSWLPPLVTGKLSDVAGLLFFPLLCTALLDCALLGGARLGLRIDFTLRRWKLLAAIGVTGICFSAIKLLPAANQAAVDIAHTLGLPARIALDPTDLFTLPALWLAWRIGLSEIARVPLGRFELIAMRHRHSQTSAKTSLSDLISAGASPAGVTELVDALDHFLDTPDQQASAEVESALAALRDLSPKRP